MEDKNNIAYWFPRIEAAGVPVPKTIILQTEVNLQSILDGVEPDGYTDFLDRIVAAGDLLGAWPMFLRTGHTSGKHQWNRTCFVPECEDVSAHVAALVEESEMCGFMGLPVATWAVREMLPVRAGCKLTAYGNMPLVREYRVFTKGGKVCCLHPYWPFDAVEKGVPDDPGWRSVLQAQHTMEECDQLILTLAENVAAALPEDDWSVDILETHRGWVVTDLALAAESFHWAGCPNEPQDQIDARQERHRNPEEWLKARV